MANRGFGNGKSTLDNGYGMFLNMLEYKLQDRGNNKKQNNAEIEVSEEEYNKALL